MYYSQISTHCISSLVRVVKIVGLSLITSYLIGCGWILNGRKQEISITTINDKSPEKTRCVLKNEEGLWKVMPTAYTIIKRDGNILDVQCVNAVQTGENQVAPFFNEGILALDNINIIAIAIDAYYNTFFSYPPFITVLMKDKKSVDFIDPLLQRGQTGN